MSSAFARRTALDAGFTLIECLAALAVLAVAAGGLIGVAQAHIDAVEGLRARTYAQWIAENRLAELQLALPQAQPRRAVMMDQAYEVVSTLTPTKDPDLQAVVIRVSRPGRPQADATLRGFIDRGMRTP